MNDITLTLTLNEINLIMSALGNAPYVQVAELVGKVKQQAQSQLETVESK